jgi:carbonic anhydrase
MSATDDLLRTAERYAAAFDKGELAAPPRRGVAVLTCMDARIEPARLLGLEEGDAHVIRNAGGLVTDDALRSLAISQRALGTREVVVIQHTGCGMLDFSDAGFRAELEQETGARPGWAVEGFSDLEQSVEGSVRALRESPFLPRRDSIRGFVLDVATGRLREVA